MQVYIEYSPARRLFEIRRRSTSERVASFHQRREAQVYAVHQGWVIVRSPKLSIPMDGTDYHVYGEC